MSTETQTREVKLGEYRYAISDESVFRRFSDVPSDGYFVDGSEAAAIRRIAELEEERDRLRDFVERYAKTGGWTGDFNDAAALLNWNDV